MEGKFNIEYVSVALLHPAEYNPRTWDDNARNGLRESIQRFGLVDPFIVNGAPERQNIVIGGHFRLAVAKELGITEVPVIYLDIPSIEREKELNLRLNRNTGEFDWKLLAQFDEAFLVDVGFTSEELDEIFDIDDNPEVFDLQKELEKLDISSIEVQKGDIWQLGEHRLVCGDSTIEADVLKLMNGEKASACICDPPYILSYLTGKKQHGQATEGFGLKRDRKYLEPDELPENFTELCMSNVAKI